MPALQMWPSHRLGCHQVFLNWKHYSVNKFTWFPKLQTGWSIFVIVNLSVSLRAKETEVIKSLSLEPLHRHTDFVDSSKGYLSFSTRAEPHLKAEITIRYQKMHAHTVKVTFPISANYSTFFEVQYGGSARHHTSAGETNSCAERQLLYAQHCKLNCLRHCNVSEH